MARPSASNSRPAVRPDLMTTRRLPICGDLWTNAGLPCPSADGNRDYLPHHRARTRSTALPSPCFAGTAAQESERTALGDAYHDSGYVFTGIKGDPMVRDRLSRHLRQHLLAAGEQIVGVPPKLMAHCRDAAGTYGKSDPIDALAVARAALREPGLPCARLDGLERELRLLTDHREDLVAERTRIINQLRWHLHELDPSWDPPTRWLTRKKHIAAVAARLAPMGGMVARIAAELTARVLVLTGEVNALEREVAVRVRVLAPSLLAVPGVAELTVSPGLIPAG